MQGVTKVRPMPGVISAFDERGCAVVDTLNDRWMYLTGDPAWVWESVEVTGTTAHLITEDMEHLRLFVEAGLMTVECEAVSAPFPTLEPVDQAPTSSPGAPQALPHITLRQLRRAWRKALHIETLSLHRLGHRVEAIHRKSGHPYLTTHAAGQLHLKIMKAAPWRATYFYRCTQRTIALATVIAADLVQTRIDLTFGMSHTAKAPSWWCSVPEGPVARPQETLAVSTL